MLFLSESVHMCNEYLTKKVLEEFGNFQLGQVISI